MNTHMPIVSLWMTQASINHSDTSSASKRVTSTAWSTHLKDQIFKGATRSLDLMYESSLSHISKTKDALLPFYIYIYIYIYRCVSLVLDSLDFAADGIQANSQKCKSTETGLDWQGISSGYRHQIQIRGNNICLTSVYTSGAPRWFTITNYHDSSWRIMIIRHDA